MGILNGAEVGLQDLNVIGGIGDFVKFFEHIKAETNTIIMLLNHCIYYLLNSYIDARQISYF